MSAPNPADPPAVADPPAPPAPAPAPAPADPAADVFVPITTQEQFDAMIQNRINRVKMTPPADYDELKAAKAELDALKAEQMSALERETAAREAAEKRALELEAAQKETNLRAAIVQEAAKPDRRVVDVEAVVSLLDRSALELADDGSPKNIADAMDKLLAEKTFLVAPESGRRGNADQGVRQPGSAKQISEAELANMTASEIVTARREGRLTGLGVGQ